MKTTRTIKLHTQEIRKDKQVFFASSAKIKDVWYKVKFTKDVTNMPKEKGLYDLTVDLDDCSFEKGKTYVSKKTGEVLLENSTIWVRKITDIRKYNDEDLKMINRAEMSEIFGEEEEVEE